MEILIEELMKTSVGISVPDNIIIPALLYADDVIRGADNRSDVQVLMKVYEKLCAEMRAATNADKTKYILFQRRQIHMAPMYLAPSTR